MVWTCKNTIVTINTEKYNCRNEIFNEDKAGIDNGIGLERCVVHGLVYDIILCVCAYEIILSQFNPNAINIKTLKRPLINQYFHILVRNHRTLILDKQNMARRAHENTPRSFQA